MDTTEILGGFEQADYSRHLEEIATRIERHLLAAVRRRLMARESRESCELLTTWERFRQLADRDVQQQTLVTESELFRHRLTVLRDVVTALLADSQHHQFGEQTCLAELRNLENRLNILAQNVAKAGSLNAGGKFEWIDSVLVKCLQDGCWLLVDNVNLCSPAVLDRLNALLEPGGTLTIGERGVGPDGQLVTVSPHPGFRLFLTMDPHNGEISRAMRNRGVEIYLLGPQEEEYNTLDLRSLLYHAGLRSVSQQDALLSVHQLMKQGASEPTISQLLHAALLISQQISLGQSHYEAYVSSCSDVYIKSCVRNVSGTSGCSDLKQKLYQLLTQTLRSSSFMQGACSGQLHDKFSLDVFTLLTPKLRRNASYVVLKQQGAVLKTLLEALVSSELECSEELMEAGDMNCFPDTQSLNCLLDIYDDNVMGSKVTTVVKVTDIIPCFLLMFYATATQSDVELRNDWLLELIAKCKRKSQGAADILKKYQLMSEILKRTLCQAFSSLNFHKNLVQIVCSVSDLPWDIRWLPDIAAFCDPKCCACGAGNKLSLLLWFTVKKMQTEVVIGEMNPGKQKSLTVMEYSAALMHGTLADDITSHCVITKFVPLIHQFDDCLEAALKSVKTSLDDDQCSSLHDALGWRLRLSGLGNLQLVSSDRKKQGKKTRNLIEEAVSKLSVHYRWLVKWTVPKLQSVIDSDEKLRKSKLVIQLEHTMKMIDASLAVSSSVLLPVGKQVKRLMCPAVPHGSKKHAELWEQVQRLSDQLCVWADSNSIHHAKYMATVSFLRTQTGMKSRLDLACAYQQLSQDENLDHMNCILNQVEELCQEFGVTCQSSDFVSKADNHLHSNAEVQVWPIQELMCVVLGGALKRALCEQYENLASSHLHTSCTDIARNLRSIMLPLPSIPPMLVAMITLLIGSNELVADSASDIVKNLFPKLMMMILKHSELSPCAKQLKNWLFWKQEASNIENRDSEMQMNWTESEANGEDSFPLHCPLMTNIVTSFVLPNCQSSSSATLGSHVAYKRQLSVLKEILWRNMKVLSAPELDYRLNDALSVQSLIQRFLHSLSLALGHTEDGAPNVGYSSLVERVIQTLQDCSSPEGQRADPMLDKQQTQFSDALIQLTETVTRLKGSISTVTNHQADVNQNDVRGFQLLVSTAEAWILLGFLQVTLYADLGLMDPVAKRKLKLQYISQERQETGRMLYAQELQSRVCSASLSAFDDCNLHPDIVALQERLKHLTIRQHKLEKCVAARPEPPLFDSLAKEALHYSNSLASAEVVLNIHRCMVDAVCKLHTKSYNDKEKMALIKRAEEMLREEQMWRESQLRFCDKLSRLYCSWYPDMVVPLLCAATQLCYGVHQLATLLQKEVIQTKMSLGHVVGCEQINLNKLMRDLVRFPYVGDSQSCVVSIVDTWTSDVTLDIVKEAVADQTEAQQCRKETFCLFKSSLEELKNLVMIRGELEDEIWMKMTCLLDRVVMLWREQEDERKQREQEEQSLYVTKSRTLSDEDEDALALAEMFPSSDANDFGDLQQQATLDQVPNARKAPVVSVVDVLTVKDTDFICQLHSHVMQSYTRCAWLSPILSSIKYSHLTPDFITPLLQRYKIFGLLLEKLSRGLDSSLDNSLYPSLTLLTACTLSYTDKGRTKLSDVGDLSLAGTPSRQGKFLVTAPKMKVFDFYRDGFVEEVKQCFPILVALTIRVKELLAQWSDHPTLKQMLVIVERIHNFPLTSPVSRFLTGFETLLDKIHEWEENAHSGVSLAPHWKSVTDQIGRWRKLELQCWKDSLDNVASGTEAAASKWWFYIYSVVESFTKDRAPESSAEELIKTFQKFMEQSTLGEYGTRLNILFTFHCHVVHRPKTACRDQLMNVLWNVYHYYCQFSEAVAARIRNLRSPIEKKLKDCVKIFRWDDISHWAIREAITKIHKTLHKHIKQFKEVLNQPITECLTNPTSETGDVNLGTWDRPQLRQPRSYQSLVEPLHFIADTRLKKLTVELDNDVEGTLFSRSGSLFMKARKLCREAILNTPYAKSVQTVEEMITDIIETSDHLKNLEVSTDLPKSKQKSQAKSFLQQKRKALADLFRGLQEIGLSYRTGLVYWNAGEVGTREFVLPPVDLHAAFQHVKSRRIDGPLLSLWDGCERYFVRSVARLALLNTSLQNPSKDLGPPAIERLRGFAVHLMVVSCEQKLLLSESCQLLCSLRSQVAQLAAIEDTGVTLPRQSELHTWLERLKALLTTCIICFEQFRILLYCCPGDDERHISSDMEIQILEFTEGLELPAIVPASKGDHVWSSAVEKIRSLVSSAVKLKHAIEKSEIVPPSLYGTKVVDADLRTHSSVLLSCAQLEVLLNAYNELEEYVKGIDMLKAVCTVQHKAEGQETQPQVTEEGQANIDRNPLIESLIWLQQYIVAETAEFSLFVKNGSSISEHSPVQQEGVQVSGSHTGSRMTEQDAAVQHFREDTEKFLRRILMAIQNVYKFNGKNYKPNGNTEQDDMKQTEDVESNNKENGSEHQYFETVELLSSTLSTFRMTQINEELHGLVQRLATVLDPQQVTAGNICRRLLLHCLPCLDQLLLFYQFFLTQQVASYRVSCKLLSVLLAIFIELAQKGFCIPPELAPSEEECQSDSTASGMGLGEGAGERDVSEQIESEEQLEEARPKGEENTADHEDCKEEEKGIEMSADFEGKVQDMEKREDEEGNSDEEDDDDEEPDKEMGETDAGAERLDQQIWGSDSEDEADENKEEERGTGVKIGEPELAANEEDNKPGEENDGQETGKQEPKRKEINEMDDPDENDDQIDPYHGKHEPQPEPEPLDLPEDLQLDGGENKDGGDEEGQEENPFDIDKMKEQNVSEGKEKEKDDKTGEDELPEGNEQIGEEMEEEGDEKEEETEETEKSDVADAEGGGSKDEEKAGDDPKSESEKEVKEETAKPSEDQPAAAPAEAAAEMDQAYGSQDKVVSDREKDKTAVEQQPAEVNGEDARDTEQGVGQAQAEKTEAGHHGDASAPKDNVQPGDNQTEQDKSTRQRLRESDSNRSLGEVSEPVKKKHKTMNTAMEEDGEEQDEGEREEEGNAEMYQHIKEAKKKFDTQTLDAATEEQAQQQPVPNLEEEDGEKPKQDDSIELQDDSVPDEDEIPTKNSERVSGDKQNKDKSERKYGERVDEGGDTDMCVEVDGDKVETLGAARGSETTFHTALGDVASDALELELMSAEEHRTMRSQLESQLATWSQPPPNEEAERAWEMFSAVTSGLARDLSEQLRLVLEPTRASRLRGDYRTGRRINMRKVIPYIASQFRKDKIWLRRTKPCKREYQIVLAVDDSSSMADNHSKELAFESLALVSQALTLLEAGELAVISFGETPRVLHQLGDPFTEKSGARLLQQFSFEQKNTRVGQLVDFVTTVFTTNCSRSSSSSTGQAQLLIIVSDGRVMSEGPDRVKQAVRRARHSGIFMVFVIVDNPESKDSILDIQQPLFSGSKCIGFSSYLDSFPFPFYLILRDINALPSVLSDALRQWFELVADMDK